MMQPTKKYTSLSKTIENLLFFIVTSVILILSLSYVPEIQKLLYKKDYSFYSTILAVGLFFISIQLSYCIKKFTIFMYKTILYNLGYNIGDDTIEEDNEKNKKDLDKYDIPYTPPSWDEFPLNKVSKNHDNQILQNLEAEFTLSTVIRALKHENDNK